MSNNLILDNNIKKLNLNKNSGNIDVNAIRLGDGVDYYNKYGFEYCWGKELTLTVKFEYDYSSDNNRQSFIYESITQGNRHLIISKNYFNCANSKEKNYNVSKYSIYNVSVNPIYLDNVWVKTELNNPELDSNTYYIYGDNNLLQQTTTIDYYTGIDSNISMNESKSITDVTTKAKYKIYDIKDRMSSGGYIISTNYHECYGDSSMGIFEFIVGPYDAAPDWQNFQNEIKAFRLDNLMIADDYGNIFYYLYDKNNNNILDDYPNLDKYYSNMYNGETSYDSIGTNALYSQLKDIDNTFVLNCQSFGTDKNAIKLGFGGKSTEIDSQGNNIIYPGFGLNDGGSPTLFVRAPINKNLVKNDGSYYYCLAIRSPELESVIVLYYGKKVVPTSPTYGFTTSQSVLCRTNLGTPIGSYQYQGTSAELNAMTILSNNGITGVSKIVEVNFVDSESLLSPNAQTTAGINMTGENTFKIYASASESTSVTVTYEIRYQK